MGVIAEDVVRVRADTTGAQGEVESGFGKIAKRAAAVFAGAFAVQKVGGFLKDTISEASDLNETMTKSQRVFGDSNKVVTDFAANAATSLGQSKNSAIGAAATFGNLFRALKIGPPAAAKMSTSMVKLGTDLASFNNVSPEEALEAIRSGLVGETEPLRKFGVNMNDATLRAEAMKLGLLDAGSTGGTALDPAIKAQAAYALIMEQTKLAQGDFQRTSGGLANQQRILSAQWTDMKASIGGALLPIITKAAVFLTGTLIPAVSELSDWIGPRFSAAVQTVSSFLGPLVAQLGGLFTSVSEGGAQTSGFINTLVTGFTDLYNSAKATFGPMVAFIMQQVGVIVEGIRANKTEILQTLSTLFTIWKTYWTAIMEVIRFVWPVIKTVISVAIKIIGDVIKVAMALINGQWGLAWQRVKTLVKDVLLGVLAIVRSILGQIVPLALAGAKAIGSAIWNGLRSEVSALPGQLKAILVKLPEVVRGLAGLFVSAAKALGEAIIRGVIEGVGSLGGALKDAVEDKIKGALDSVNPFSPIEVGAARLLGEPIVEGTLAGVAGLGPALQSAVESGMRAGLSGAPRALGTAGAGAGVAGGLGSPQVAIHGPVTIQTDDPRRFLDDLMSRAKR